MENNKGLSPGNKGLDISSLMNKLIKHWYLFIISLIIWLGFAILFYKYAAPQYLVGSKMIISLSGYNQNGGQGDLVQGFNVQEPSKNLQNEILKLKSFPMLKKVAKDLGFMVSYFYKEDYLPYKYFPFNYFPGLILREMYGDVPFQIQMDEEHPQPVGETFYIKILNNEEFQLSIDVHHVEMYNYKTDLVLKKIKKLKISNVFKFGETIKGPDYSFRVLLNSNYNEIYNDKDLYFSFNNFFHLIRNFQDKRLKVEYFSFVSSGVDISLKGRNINKQIAFVNGLTNEYIQQELSRKDYIASSTIKYIDEQLSDISQSLNTSEGQLQSFRRKNQLMDINSKSRELSQQLNSLESERNQKLQDLQFYKELLTYFEENENSANLLTPVAMGVNDQTLNDLILKLANYNAEFNTLIKNKQQRSVKFKTLRGQIDDLKVSILNNIKFYISSTEGVLNEINNKISKYDYEFQKLPTKQRTLVGIERKYNLNNDVYNFLLQKQAESQILRASNIPDSEVIEPAIYLYKSFPNKKTTIFLAFFLGIGFPFALVFVKYFFNDKVQDVDEIKFLTNFRFLGPVFHNNKRIEQVMVDFPQDMVSESFRAIRTNLNTLKNNDSHQTVLVTSTFSEEGKSFITLNLAISLAYLDKKTLIVGFDMRKPNGFYTRYVDGSTDGLSNYFNEEGPIEKYIHGTPVKNLDMLLAGTPSPNPAELIESNRTLNMLNKLKSLYDYIIIDTPPIGPVTDAYMIMKHADVTIFVIRQNRTLIKPLHRSLEEIEQKQVKNPCIIFNDVKNEKKEYGYGYKDSYYRKNDRKPSSGKNLLHKLLNR